MPTGKLVKVYRAGMRAPGRGRGVPGPGPGLLTEARRPQWWFAAGQLILLREGQSLG